ncbi:hypothetical protein FA15DRAFT_709984 [Coprinopsis marcescibilis]|uniref:Uncharacterized protein n=1 Tax=Coprinopsis marcescibilis TaxID=230819 RepID=A0A5C3KE79_COPMA|nr:hypothetical protein FA15DRAFT_709984 [Coprinopsis marcescibilis]
MGLVVKQAAIGFTVFFELPIEYSEDEDAHTDRGAQGEHREGYEPHCIRLAMVTDVGNELKDGDGWSGGAMGSKARF